MNNFIERHIQHIAPVTIFNKVYFVYVPLDGGICLSGFLKFNIDIENISSLIKIA